MAKAGFGKSGGGGDNLNSKLLDSPMSSKMMGHTGSKAKGLSKHTGSGKGRRHGHVGHMSGGNKY